MKWEEIKRSIVEDLSSRGLKGPMIRIRALDKIEAIMLLHYPSYIENPDEFKKIGKEEFKRQISEKKGRDLNGAEKSVINEIYYKVNPYDSLLNYKTTLPPSVKYRICVCPYCFTSHELTEDLWGYDNLTCLQCGNTIPNPVKEEELLKKIAKGEATADFLWGIGKLILILVLFAFFLAMCAF